MPKPMHAEQSGTPKITLAEKCGFCFGVSRAVEIAEKHAKKNPKQKVYTLGPIIHNPQEIERLEELGVRSIENLRQAEPNSTVIIRAHGVPPSVYKEAKNCRITLEDATCPYVKIAQNRAKTLLNEGYKIAIIGEKMHPEVIGLQGNAQNTAEIIEFENEAESFPETEKLGIVMQTTQDEEKAYRILNILSQKSKEIKIYNTICSATRERQNAAKALAKNADLMIVIGGKNSGNTTRLAQICSAITQTHHIETASEIKPEWIKDAKNIGITAGASTPDFIIEDVVSKFKGKTEEIKTSVALLIKGNKVLLEKRGKDRSHYADCWAFPGGIIKPNETPKEALERRMKEELGIELKSLKQISRLSDQDKTSKHWFLHTFFQSSFSGTPKPKLGQNIEWHPLGSIQNLNIPPAFKKSIQRLINPIQEPNP